MNSLLEVLSDFGFNRLSSTLSLPIIVHCVPGAGKSSVIRELLRRDRSFKAYTLGTADTPTIEGADIQKYKGCLDSDYNCILDEYHHLSVIPEGVFAVFGDPQQSLGIKVFGRPDFSCLLTKRFGRGTAALLNKLGYTVVAEKEDSLKIEGIFTGEPVGQIIYFERCIGELLKSNNASALHILDCIGATFKEVTFVTTGELHPDELYLHYLCLTRHSSALLILAPNATYGPS